MVVDTSVFIEHLRAKDKRQTTLALLPPEATYFVSILTRYEHLCGAKTPLPKQDVTDIPSNTYGLPIDAQIVEKAAEVYRTFQQRNQLIGAMDVLLAATAFVHNQPVKTLNLDHFRRVDGLILL